MYKVKALNIQVSVRTRLIQCVCVCVCVCCHAPQIIGWLYSCFIELKTLYIKVKYLVDSCIRSSIEHTGFSKNTFDTVCVCVCMCTCSCVSVYIYIYIYISAGTINRLID